MRRHQRLSRCEHAQSALTPLERGRHAQMATVKYGTHGGLSIAKYAKETGRKERTVFNETQAWEVYQEAAESADVGKLQRNFSQLVAIHAAPREQWAALAEQMIAGRATGNVRRNMHVSKP